MMVERFAAFCRGCIVAGIDYKSLAGKRKMYYYSYVNP